MSPGAGVGIAGEIKLPLSENHPHKMKGERNEETKGDRENIVLGILKPLTKL